MIWIRADVDSAPGARAVTKNHVQLPNPPSWVCLKLVEFARSSAMDTISQFGSNASQMPTQQLATSFITEKPDSSGDWSVQARSTVSASCRVTVNQVRRSAWCKPHPTALTLAGAVASSGIADGLLVGAVRIREAPRKRRDTGYGCRRVGYRWRR